MEVSSYWPQRSHVNTCLSGGNAAMQEREIERDVNDAHSAHYCVTKNDAVFVVISRYKNGY
jgi:hypothetical protein